jgi:OOP family OmpA-OmpF porin
METRGLGESQPLAPNETASGADDPAARQLNRRVELVLLDP